MSKTKASLGVIAATLATVMTLFLLPFQPKLAVRTVTVGRGELLRTTLLEGVVAYMDEQPCMAAQTGKIDRVYCARGQTVRAGELLFSLDVSMEEAALAALQKRRYEGEKLIADCGEAVSLAFASEALAWAEKEAALRQSIEWKRVRAARDGVVGEVYVSEGEYVAQGALLGLTRSAEKCVVAVWRQGGGVPPADGAAAAVDARLDGCAAPAYLLQTGAPSLDQQTGEYAQRLIFALRDGAALDGRETGTRAVVEVVNEAVSGAALVPVEAVGEGNLLWLVRGGAAAAVKVDAAQRNESCVRVPDELLGERVILLPDEAGVSEGRAVKEAKAR